MNNLPYFFLLLKKNIGLWTLIATGSFAKMDTAHLENTRRSPYAMYLKNYSLSEKDTFSLVSISSFHGLVSINFKTSNPKYLDSVRYYFGTTPSSGHMESEYTINGFAMRNSSEMLEPIDIGLDRKAHVHLIRSGENEYKVMLMFYAKNHWELSDKFMDSIRRVDSAMYGLRGQPPPYLQKLSDSASHLGWDMDRRLTDTERVRFAISRIDIINKAIKADSSYLDGYQYKFGWETELKRYNGMIVTGKHILKLSSDSDIDRPETTYRLGEAYELTGKMDSAKVYYESALSLYDRRLSKEDNDDIVQDEMFHKGLVLILLNNEQEGRNIFKELSENLKIAADEREYYHNFFVRPRSEFLQKMNP